MKGKTTQLSENNIREYLYNLEAKDFSTIKKPNQKIDKFNFI